MVDLRASLISATKKEEGNQSNRKRATDQEQARGERTRPINNNNNNSDQNNRNGGDKLQAEFKFRATMRCSTTPSSITSSSSAAASPTTTTTTISSIRSKPTTRTKNLTMLTLQRIIYGSLLMLALVLIQQCDITSGQTASSAAIKDFQSDGISSGPTKKCGPERHIEMDKCASNLGFLGDRTFVMPKNVTQMNGFCSTLTRSLKCIQNYARECLTSFPRQVLLTVTRNGRKQYNQLCENDVTKQEFIDKLMCLEPDNLEQLHQCMDGSIARFEYVANQVEADNRISAICCSYQIFRRDIQETVEKTCSKYPRVDQTAHYLHEIISTTTGELIELVCGAYKTFEECKSKPKMANLVTTFTEITSKTKTKLIKPRAKSLISLFVNILNSF